MHKSGRLVWARVSTSITREGAGADEPRLLVHTEDISERRRGAEDLLRAHEEAERANRAKSDFLSRMSHELRTPLNAVLGFAQLLESEDLSDEQRASVTRILSGGYHLLNLVNDVLDMSAIEAGHLPISSERVAVGAVVRATIELMSPLADQRSIRTHADLRDGDIAVLANEQRLKQVLLNLVSNAVKYSRADADVTVAVERAGDSRVRIHVIDSGHGIPAEKLERAFLPFERLGERREVEGTGLGLPLSRNLVQAMGGTLTVESGSAGSTFTVELPLAEGAQEQSEHANGGTARRLTPDVVALDLQLPDMTGAAVLAALRDDEATRAVPVIVVTADATLQHEQQLRDAGATAYLTKPLDLARFEAELGRALWRTPADG
jgi:signal transduction histidine kinase